MKKQQKRPTKTPKGEIGELLRKFGIYWSQLSIRRKTYVTYGSEGFSRKKNEKEQRRNLLVENEKLKKEVEELTKNLAQAELVIDLQKKLRKF